MTPEELLYAKDIYNSWYPLLSMRDCEVIVEHTCKECEEQLKTFVEELANKTEPF